MNNYILYAILILTGLLGTYAIIPLFRSLLIESNVLRPNYKKDMIPVSIYIFIWISIYVFCRDIR